MKHSSPQQTSNPHLKRAPFRPNLIKKALRHTRLYDLLHGMHVVRMQEFRTLVSFLTPHGSLLDVGCGDGYYTKQFSQKLNAPCLGIDLMPARIERAQYYNSTSNCRFQLGDALALPLESESFDQIVSLGSLEHFDDDFGVLKEMNRVLKPGGTLAISCDAFLNVGYSTSELQKHSEKYYVQRYYTPQRLTQVLEQAGFHLDKIEGIFCSPVSIQLIRGAYRFGCDWSNPLYNVYSAVSDPFIRLAEKATQNTQNCGIFLAACAQKL